MQKLKNNFILFNESIINAFTKMTNNGSKCLIVSNKNNLLIGTLSDGDVRKALLKGSKLNDSINGIYNKKPIDLSINYELKNAEEIFLKYKIDLIPIVNKKKVVVDILFWHQIFKKNKNYISNKINSIVVIMAGGKGERLKPITQIIPKPLIPIDNKTVIEHIIDKFQKYQIKDFYITINYKAKILRAYFEELSPSCSVNFIKESKPLGTAGGLSKLISKIKKTFFLTNCDIMIDIDYNDVLKFHKVNNLDITIVASIKEYEIPYGVCETDSRGFLKKIKEKPKFEFLFNTGFYILEPSCLKIIPKNTYYDMNIFIQDLKKKKKKIGVFPISNASWIDIGQLNDYKKLITDISSV